MYLTILTYTRPVKRLIFVHTFQKYFSMLANLHIYIHMHKVTLCLSVHATLPRFETGKTKQKINSLDLEERCMRALAV
jgi:hypothetical protein